MGKPTSAQLSRRSSNQSLNISKSKMNLPVISSQKSIRAKKKKHDKTDKTIKILFTQLRNESRKHSQENIIELDDTGNSLNNTILINDSKDISNKSLRKSSLEAQINTTAVRNISLPQSPKIDTIFIKDDAPSQATPRNRYSLHHSTPIKNKSIDQMLITLNKQLVNVETNNNVTKEINRDSFLTIDLTTESISRTSQHTVIDLDADITNDDCMLTSISNASSMSGDSDVTILKRPARSKSQSSQIKKLKNGLFNLNERDKNKILAFLSENLLNGCSVPAKLEPRAIETAEDTYIREVIVGKASRSSIGSNIYNPERYVNTSGLRMVVIDGSNVAMAHGNHTSFSVKGLKIVVDYFLRRGHAVKAFVPRFRNLSGKSSDPQMLVTMERRGHVIFTPSREVQGRMISSYDDRYIIQCAAEFEGVIVSNDAYRDLINENPRWREVIMHRLLQYNWVNGMIMFPLDPLGRNGPNLRQFLSMPKKNVNTFKL